MKHFILIIFLSLNALLLLAQETVYRHYTVNDGLPDNEVYYAMQDSKGYMWFATNSGVSRFNGYEFENFSVNEGLTSNSILELYEDYKGRIWFLPYNCQYSYYENGEIHEYPYNDVISENLGVSVRYHNLSFSLDSNNVVQFSCADIYSIDSIGNFKIDTLTFKDRRGLKINKDLKYANTWNKKRFDIYVDHHELEKVCGVTSKDTLWLRTDHKKSKWFKGQCLSIVNPNEFLLVARNDILFVSYDFKEVNKFFLGERIIALEYIAPYVYIGLQNGGIQKYHISDFTNPVDAILKNYSITSYVRDRQNGQWYTTLYNGVYYNPNDAIKTYAFGDAEMDDLWHIDKFNDQIIACTKNGMVIDPIGNRLVDQIQNEIVEAMSFNPYDGKMYFGANYIYKFDGESFSVLKNNHPHYSVIGVTNSIRVKSFLFSEHDLKVGGSNNLYRVVGDSIVYSSYGDENFPIPCRVIQYSANGDVWIGSTNGLWRYDNQNYYPYRDSSNLLSARINDMFFSNIDSTLVIGTNGSGILLYSKDTLHKLTVEDGLLSNAIQTLHQSDSIIWAGSNLGLNEIVMDDNSPNGFVVHSYTINDGLPDNKINDILYDNGLVYLATNAGMVSMNHKSIKSTYSNIPLYIDLVQILHKDTLLTPNMKLKYNENFIDINYTGLSMSDNGKLKYRYQLDGLHNDWIHTYNRSIKFASLAPGKYSFKVQAQNKAGEWSESTVFDFQIAKPFWNTTLFKVVLVLFILGVVLVVMRYRIQRIRNENKLKEDVISLRQEALSKQIDPHFIYNSLNSIQSFILKNDSIVAIKYLAKFSKLMRKVLHNSNYSDVSVSDEMEAISLYLELERVRFEKKFEFNVDVDPELISNIAYIPSFFIQPFVENAIWHGVMNLKDGGEITLKLKKQVDNVKIEIQDNGIGVIEGKKRSQKKAIKHKSMGVEITKQRLELINKLYHTKYEIQILDLSELNQGQQGTVVKFNLPLFTQ